MTMIRSILFGLLLTLAAPLSALAQCSGQAPALTFCGNPTGSLALPGWKALSAIPFPTVAGGTVIGNRGTTSAIATAMTNPVLGIPGTSSGQLGFAGATSGTATIVPQTVAGSPILTLPNTSGTFAVNASTPLVLSTTTGALTCPTCVTSSGGGAITGTAPISVSAAGVVSIDAPYITLVASNGGIVYSGAANLAILSGTATARQMLQSGASGAPSWSTATWPATTTINRILYSSAANVVGEITSAASSIMITNGSSVPSFSTTLPAFTLGGTVSGGGNQINNVIIGSTSPLAGSFTSLAYSTTLIGTSTSATCLAIGRQGSTNPGLSVDCSTASNVTGVQIQPAAVGNGVVIQATSSGTDETVALRAKGTTSGNVQISGRTIFLDQATNVATTVSVGGISGGGVTFNIGGPGDGVSAFNVYTVAGAIQTWVSGGGSTTITFPGATTTLVGRDTTDTLTNKTLTSPVIATIQSSATVQFLNGAGAQSIDAGGVCVESVYSNCSAIPSSGIYSRGNILSGLSGTVGGALLLDGATSGRATIKVAAAAGTTNFQLPVGNGSSGQVLSTDGAGNTSWIAAAGGGTVTSVSAGTGMSFTTITTTGSVAIDKAGAGNLEAGTSNKVLTADIIYDGAVGLTFSATPTWDFNGFLNATLTLTGNITSLTCANIKASQSGVIALVQDATGNRTMVSTWCSQFRWAGGSRGVLSTAANAVDTLFYQCLTTSVCYVSLSKAQAN